MKDSSNSSNSPNSASAVAAKFFPWQQLKGKRVAYLTLPLLVMATLVEFVILATGWKYQQMVCLPQGMGVTFFGIGPIGATILAVELLKLPLAIWTASRHGWQKTFMLFIGLPLICVLTFQLVKDMAVYEMGTAMTPASQFLEKAAAEEIKIAQLNGELAAIEQKKTDRERKLAELTAKRAKAKADFEASLKRVDEARHDAINLTDYQKKELSEVHTRQANIIAQFNADADQLTKTITGLRARRDAELPRATQWNAEEARIENEYKSRKAAYDNKKAAYEKDKREYDNAHPVRRAFMSEPVDPGVPPEREVNRVIKPTLIADLDEQIKAKEAELLAVNNKRRDSVAQVDADARRLREDFDKRSSTKRESSDKKREELMAAEAALAKELKAEEQQADLAVAAAVQKVDGIRAELDATRKKAEGFYEAREAAIRQTQVHRIATTVEIVRGLIFGERPMSITATAKERGDILTDQISMVRIWVYPVLAFIVAFLPTLMVEIGFSTVFKPEQARPQYRLGFMGRRLHWLYTRAGRQKILRAERLASKASAEIAVRDRALAETKAGAEAAFAGKEAELQQSREEFAAAKAAHEEQLKWLQAEHAEQTRTREEEWVAKLASMADSLNRTVVEKDALRDLQKSEVERQIQMRQNAWSDRLAQLRQELDEQRAASEAERTAMMEEHQKKLFTLTEDCKSQVIQARRQASAAELAALEKTTKLGHDLKEALLARDAAEAQLKHQTDTLEFRLTQAQEDAAREVEKVRREEKNRVERQQLELEKALRQRDETLEQRVKQQEQEFKLVFETRLAEEKSRLEQENRLRELEHERQLEVASRESDARWKRELDERENAAADILKQREQQQEAQAEARLREVQKQAEERARVRESEFERQLQNQARAAEARLREELQAKELYFLAKLKQREQEFAMKADARATELQKQWAADLREREEEWQLQADSRVRAAENRITHEVQQAEEILLNKSRQRDQQWQAKLDTARAELQEQSEEMRLKEETAQARIRQREHEVVAQLTAQAEARQIAARSQWEAEAEKKTRAAIEPFKLQISRVEKEREQAQQAAADAARQVQSLEIQLTEASSFLNAWRNGKKPAGSS